MTCVAGRSAPPVFSSAMHAVCHRREKRRWNYLLFGFKLHLRPPSYSVLPSSRLSLLIIPHHRRPFFSRPSVLILERRFNSLKAFIAVKTHRHLHLGLFPNELLLQCAGVSVCYTVGAHATKGSMCVYVITCNSSGFVELILLTLE